MLAQGEFLSFDSINRLLLRYSIIDGAFLDCILLLILFLHEDRRLFFLIDLLLLIVVSTFDDGVAVVELVFGAHDGLLYIYAL